QAIGDVRIEIEAITPNLRVSNELHPATPTRPPWKRAISLILSAVFASAVTAVVVFKQGPRASEGTVRFNFTIPEGVEYAAGGRGVPIITVAPDGSRTAFSTRRQLFIRDIADTEFH